MVWWLRLVTPADLLAAWRMVWSRLAARLPGANRRGGSATTDG
jgi:hypothetical protein